MTLGTLKCDDNSYTISLSGFYTQFRNIASTKKALESIML